MGSFFASYGFIIAIVVAVIVIVAFMAYTTQLKLFLDPEKSLGLFLY